jgi:hypothetical protein
VVPTCFFDGGYRSLTGGTIEEPPYTSRIVNCGHRDAHDIYLEVTLTYVAANELQIDYVVTSNGLTNDAPTVPAVPDGRSYFPVEEEHYYVTAASDADGDDVYYRWSFGDGDSTAWLGPYDSGDTCMVNHTWPIAGSYLLKVNAKDKFGALSGWSDSLLVTTYDWVCGDADSNDIVNVSDAVYLIGYIFGGGPAPDPLLSGDADCNLIVNVSDAVFLIGYIFGGGPAPCSNCP